MKKIGGFIIKFELIKTTRFVFLFWVLIIALIISMNSSSFLQAIITVVLLVTLQLLFLFLSFKTRILSGILLVLESIVIFMLTYPLKEYGGEALIGSIFILVIPPFTIGLILLIKNKVNK